MGQAQESCLANHSTGDLSIQDVASNADITHYTYKQTKARRLKIIDYRWKQSIATPRTPHLVSDGGRGRSAGAITMPRYTTQCAMPICKPRALSNVLIESSSGLGWPIDVEVDPRHGKNHPDEYADPRKRWGPAEEQSPQSPDGAEHRQGDLH